MYRAVALATARARARSRRASPTRSRSRSARRCSLDGRDVTAAIREPEVSAGASRVAADPGVRAALVRKQQEIVKHGDWVAEGRDIGSVVAPDAKVKVFLTATPEERARRRAAELGADHGDGARRAQASATSGTRAPTARSRGRPPDATTRRHHRARARRGRRADRALVEAGEIDEDRRRRLSQRRQVLAGQPPHTVARGGRPRAGRASRATARSSRPTGTGAASR